MCLFLCCGAATAPATTHVTPIKPHQNSPTHKMIAKSPTKLLEEDPEIVKKKKMKMYLTDIQTTSYLQNENQKTLLERIKTDTRYPQQFETRLKDVEILSGLLADSGDKFKDLYSNITDTTNRKLEKGFLARGLYDLYDIQFQDLALALTAEMSQEDLQKLGQGASGLFGILVYRARNIAISSRYDLDWTGKRIEGTAIEQKKKEIQGYYHSLVIYNPLVGSFQEKMESFNGVTPIAVSKSKTTDAAIQLLNDSSKDPNKVGKLIMANRVRMGGSHQKDRGTQEEFTGPDSGMFSVLSTICTHDTQEQGRAIYQDGYVLPPGGVAFLNARLFDGSNQGSGQDCSYLVSGFADFRVDSPESEFENFAKDGKLLINNNYRSRIKIEMVSVLEAAIHHGKTRLVLGASGCGAFLHDAKTEAEEWKVVLAKYTGYFEEIVFAIDDQSTADIFAEVFK